MMKVLLIILISLASIILLGIIVNLIFYFVFKARIKKFDVGIALTLDCRYQLSLELVELYEKNNLVIDEELKKHIQSFDREVLIHNKCEDNIQLKRELYYISSTLISLGEQNSEIAQDESFIHIIESINELDKIYRSSVISYNTEVLGYNYWLNFPSLKLIFKLAKRKERQLIS